VVKPGDHAIKNAIHSARPGDTVLIFAGHYPENNILVNKRLVLIGSNWPVIDGQKKDQVMVITADNVTVHGLEIRNTGRSSMTDMAAIRIQEATGVEVSGNRLINNTYGVYLQEAEYATVKNNTIQGEARDELNSGNGVHAWQCHHLYINGNSISGHRDGIYFEFVTYSHISGNKSFSNVRYGLHFMFSHNDAYIRNIFTANGAGVAVMYSRHVTMLFNEYIDNWGEASYAILMKEITDSRVEWSLFRKNTVGLYLEGTNRITARHNRFIENGWAIRIQSNCSETLCEKNNFKANSFDVATSGSLSLSTFTGNFWDKYDGYDLNKDGTGDVPYYPVSLYSMISENAPAAMILFRSFFTSLIEEMEKVLPTVTPDKLRDDKPRMYQIPL
jgi:nitrous oxidase accessory protein